MKCKTCKYYWNNGKDEYCDKRGWDFKRIDCPDFASKYKPKTNADRIRSLTDEELAELWWERVDCGECPVHRNCRMTGQDCKKLALDWLKQEVSE